MYRRWMLAVMMVVVIAFGSACAGDQEDQPEEKPAETYEPEPVNENQAKLDAVFPAAYRNTEGLELEPGTYISVLGKSGEGAYWDQIQKGLEQAEEDLNELLGYEGDDEIRVVYNAPDEANDVDDQVNILDEELARYPAALGIAIVDSQSCEVQFDLAAENGIPIVTFDSASAYPGIMAKIQTDNKEAARKAASGMAGELREKGKVMILAQDSRSDTTRERVGAFKKEMKDSHPGIEVVNTYYLNQHDELAQQVIDRMAGSESRETEGSEETEDAPSPEDIGEEDILRFIFEENPDIDGIYAADGAAVMLAADCCEQYKRENVTIVGFDMDEDAQEALQDGRIAGLILQNPYGMGYATVVAAARSILGMGNEAVVDTGFVWVTKDNLESEGVQKFLAK